MSLPFWEYFLAIEEDLERCTRYVEFCEGNYGTSSLEFARIIMASGAECDTVMALLCKSIGSPRVVRSITDRFQTVAGKYPKFVDHEVEIPRYGIVCRPWETWSATTGPDWWKMGYNKIKHERDKFFKNANLKYAIGATAGLLCTLLYYYRELDPEKKPVVMVDYLHSPTLLLPRRYNTAWQGAEIMSEYDFPQ